MATKTTTKTTKTSSKKNASAKEPKKEAPAAKAKESVPASPETPEPETAEPSVEESSKPEKKHEALSLIEKTKKRVEAEEEEASPKGSILPPISRIQSEKARPKAQPEPAPEEDHDALPDGVSREGNIIHIKPPIIVRDLAAALDVKPFQLIHDLMEMNIFAAINHSVERDVASKLCEQHGFVFEVEKREKGGGVHKVEEVIEAPPTPVIEEEEELKTRAPIITMMGHVDHGKTSLLDAIRNTKVVDGEAGGITQHIGAYQVTKGGREITFVDTPGHEAFTSMRARGANVTDIVILVVAADDGLMPQSIESINHAKAANVSIIVAINKMDLPGANPDRVKQQLQEKELIPEDWGGETICCEVSATKGDGIDHLLEMILLQSEMMELKSSPTASPRATVIEGQFEAGRGPTATVIVSMGTLKVGQPFICGDHWGKVKSLISDKGERIKEAGPATPVKVVGLNGLPNAGDELAVMDTDRAVKVLSAERRESKRAKKLAAPQRATLESLFKSIDEGKRKSLNLIIKSDVQGSLEAVLQSLQNIDSDKVDLNFIHSAVGPISESDVLLASTSDAVIVGFNVKVDSSAAPVAKSEGVQIKLFSIIYELIDQIKEAMAGMLEPELRETPIGHAEVKQVFQLSRGKVAGCIVTDGRISRSARARVLRGRQPMYDGGIGTLRRFQDDVKEVRAGVECGIKLGDFSDYEVGDVIECYLLEKVAQAL